MTPSLPHLIAYLARHGGIQPSETQQLGSDAVAVYEAMKAIVAEEEHMLEARAESAVEIETSEPIHPDVAWFYSDPSRVARCAGEFVGVRDRQVIAKGTKFEVLTILNGSGVLIDCTGCQAEA